MRAIRAFILRLLVNSAEPGAPLRGDLRPVPEGEPMLFADEEALLALLHRLVAESTKPSGKAGDDRP